MLALAVMFAAGTTPPSAYAAPSSKPKITITSVKTTQVAKAKTRTTTKIVLTAPKTAATVQVRVSVNPTGKVAKTGKTITRKVKARWSKGAYRATVKVSAGGPGKVTASAKVAGKTYKQSRKSPGKLTTKLTGWDASRTVKPGSKLTDTVKVSPAWGRKVQLQERVGTRWVTRKTITTAKKKTAKVKVTLTGPKASGPATTKWRVRAPGTAHSQAKNTPTRSLTRQGTPPTPPTPEPPTPDPEHPGWPRWCGTDGWGDPVECYRPTISTVLDRWTYNPRCYHEQECWRGGGAYYDDYEWPARWTSDELWASARSNWKPLAAPDFLKHLNDYRQSTSAFDGKARRVLRPAPWSITVNGYTVQGQGGHAQMWAMKVGQAMSNPDRPMQQSDHSDTLQRWDWVNARWPDARGYWWVCTENLSGTDTAGSSKGLFGWTTSSGHRSALLDTSISYSSFGGALADNGDVVLVYQGCQLVISKTNWNPAYETDGVTPAIWRAPAGWTAPSNDW